MIDLHTHTNYSDGELSPQQLIEQAKRAGITALGITDHDTFAGYDQARQLASSNRLELICGIELSTSFNGRPVHLLGYFIDADPTGLRSWVSAMQNYRFERNRQLAARLQQLGAEVTVDEAAARGRGLTGRVHFAQVLVDKGYVSSVPEAFTKFLGEAGSAYVPLLPARFSDAVRRIRAAGGVASLAHPVRVPGKIASMLPAMCDAGLNAIEAYHSDHTCDQTACYLSLAKQYSLLITGGSDFHGPSVKPGIQLGTGRQQNPIAPDDLLDRLKKR